MAGGQTARLTPTRASIAIGGLAAAAYLPSLLFGFVWDDLISLNRWLPALPHWWSAFAPPVKIPQFPPDYYRPLQLVSYQIDRAAGGGAAWPFHLSSLILHVAATLLVFATARRLFQRRGDGSVAALLAAALFAVHPIHVESVAWMAARPDLMVAGAGLAALLAYNQPKWAPIRRAVVAASLVLVALLCKENALALLLLVPASSWALDEHLEPPPIATLAAFAATALAYFALRSLGVYGAPAGSILDLSLFPAAAIALATDLRLLILPYPQNALIDQIPMNAAALVGDILAVLAFAAIALSAWRRRDRSLLYALFWIVLTLVPSLAVLLKPPTAPLAERYLYLPSAGFCWAIGGLAAPALTDPRRRRMAMAAFAAIVLLCLAVTWRRSSIWRDDYALWSDTAAKSAASSLPLRNLAAATLARGDAAEAEALFRRALAGRNNGPRDLVIIHNNLGSIALGRGDAASAEADYRRSLAIDPTSEALYNLGLLRLRAGANAEARTLFEQAAAANPYDADTHLGIGYAAQALGDDATARREFEEALRLGLPPDVGSATRKRLGNLR